MKIKIKRNKKQINEWITLKWNNIYVNIYLNLLILSIFKKKN